ncbi:MAG: deoxyribose-phosphate aldolase [Ilumatobacteraceae bacterium]
MDVDADAAVARRALPLVDLTDLSETCSVADVEELCRRATGRYGSTAAVCIWPRFVSLAADRLRGSGVRVATVVNFPLGGTDVGATVAETVQAVADGADEIDVVLPFTSFLAGYTSVAVSMVQAVRTATPPPMKLKVILESGEYPDLDQVAAAARLAIEHGADFVKTSTGKSAVSATLAAAVTIIEQIRRSGRPVGIKVAGGVRTVQQAERYLAIADEMMGPGWVSPATFRFGASGLLDGLEAAIAEAVEPRDVAAEPVSPRAGY